MHDLATTNGKTAMAYFGETPWHRLGTKLEEPATAKEAINAAGLDYEVELRPLQTTAGQDVSMRKAVVRNDSNQVLGVVGNAYRPIQNQQCFSFLDKVAANGQVTYHTAGALGSGERIWMLAKLPNVVRVKGSDDITEQYLLLSNSHNGTSSLRVFFTPIRVVCANTLQTANRQGRGQGVSFRHSGDLDTKVSQAQRVLGLATSYYDELDARIDHLASIPLKSDQVESYFSTLFPDTPDTNTTRTKNVRAKLLQLFDDGKGQDIPEIRHTAWAAFNAVTEYVDHHRPSRGKSDMEVANNRLKSAWFGSGSSIKNRAWEQAFQLTL